MSLDNITLPGFIIQDLFQKCLVDVNENNYGKVPAEKGILNFYGGNNQQITILVNNPDETYLSTMDLDFLSGILNACKLSMEDVALVNMATSTKLYYQTISKQLVSKIVLLFGVLPAAIELPFVIPEFQKQLHNNQIYLCAPSLNLLQNNTDLKRKLWVSLKQIFSL